MDTDWKKTLRNFGIEAKRAAERTTNQAMKHMGMSAPKDGDLDPQLEQFAETYAVQTASLKQARDGASALVESLARSSAAAHTLASALHGAVGGSSGAGPAARAAEGHLSAQASIRDGALRRLERRLHKRVTAPIEDELMSGREVAGALEQRRKVAADYRRYRARYDDVMPENAEDVVKADDKLRELQTLSESLRGAFSAAVPRRSAMLDKAAQECAEVVCDYHAEAASALEAAVGAGSGRVSQSSSGADLRARQNLSSNNTANNSADLLSEMDAVPEKRPPRSKAASMWEDDDPLAEHEAHAESTGHFNSGQRRGKSAFNQPKQASGGSIWDEEPSPRVQPMNQPTRPASPSPVLPRRRGDSSGYPSGGVGQRESSGYPTGGVGQRESTGYPSGGVGQRESTGYPTGGVGQRESSGYPSGGVGQRESAGLSNSGSREDTSAYPSNGVGQKSSVYPTRRVPTARARPNQAAPKKDIPKSTSRDSGMSGKTADGGYADDLLQSFGMAGAPAKPSRQRKSSGPAAAAASSSGNLDDFLNFGSAPAAPQRTQSAAAPSSDGDLLGVFGSRPSRAPGRSKHASNSPPTASKPQSRGKASSDGSNLNRAELQRKSEAEIKARADEKLAAVREREAAATKEREKKDDARSATERKINQWTGNGARRGNLRALLASLDSVIYPSSTWKAVSMDVLKDPNKVKLNYKKAIVQLHPDKIGPKNLPPDQQVLAELIFDEIQNANEVFTAELDGKPPPPGSVGPKNAKPGMGGMGGMSGMNMGRGGMGGMGGMNMGGMGGMGGMNMGRGMGGMGMNGMGGMGGMNMGRGMGGMGMNGMGGRGMGMNGGFGGMYGNQQQNGRGTGNMPYGTGRAYGMGMNQQQRR